MIHVTLQHGYAPITLVAVLGVALAIVAFFYRRVYEELSTRQWRILYGLRTIAIVLVVLLLFRPVVTAERWVTERRTVVFLVDSSSSMSVSDGSSGETRWDQARRHLLRWWGQLDHGFELKLLAFDSRARPVPGPDRLSKSARGAATSLVQALRAGRRQASSEQLEALVVLSDGVHNAAGSPEDVAKRLGVPIYTIATGSSLHESSTFRDVRVTGFDLPEQLTLENRVRVTAHIDASGLPGHIVEVVLEEDDTTVATQKVTLDDAEGSTPVQLEFVPESKGVHRYTVRIPAVQGEKIPENNERTATALVVDARIRVLYIEGTLRAEYGAITGMFLAKDPNIEYCALVQTRPNVFTQRTNIEGLSLSSIPRDAETFEKFDVFLIGDLDSSFLDAEQMKLLQKRVSEGAGLLMMGGYHSLGPGGYGETPVEAILPVFVGSREMEQSTTPFVPQLTLEGVRHPVFANIVKFFPKVTGEEAVEPLPPLQGCVRIQGLKPGASVLAVHPDIAIEGKPMPVLAVQRFGKGRTAVFTGDTTRRWHQALRAADRDSPFLRFWGQLVRWLAGRTAPLEASASVTVQTDRRYYEPGAPVTISALVRNDRGEGSNDAKVTARIAVSKTHTRRVPLSLVPGPAGHYEHTFESLPPGRHEVHVSAVVDGKRIDAEVLTVEVGRPNLEFDRLDVDEKTLTAIASASGGRYSHITTADRLIESLRNKQHARRVQLEMPLYQPSLFWLLFVAVLTTEWILRRRYRLR